MVHTTTAQALWEYLKSLLPPLYEDQEDNLYPMNNVSITSVLGLLIKFKRIS